MYCTLLAIVAAIYFAVKSTFDVFLPSTDIRKHIHIYLPWCLDPGLSPDHPHPSHCGEVAAPAGKWNHS